MTTITVSSNHISALLTINANDTLNVLSGGTVIDTTVNSGRRASLQRLGTDKCVGIGSSDTKPEGSMTWMIFLAAFNGTLFQPLNNLPTFQSAEACYNFIALLNYKVDEHTRLICVPR